MSLLSLTKKGQFHNYMAVIVTLFAFGFLSIFGTLYLSEVISGFNSAGYYSTSYAVAAGTGFIFASHIYDYIILLLMIVLIIGLAYTSYRIASPAIFFIITLISAGIYGFVGYFFSYVFKEMVSQPVFTATLLYYPNTLKVCGNLHWVGLACVIIGSIAMYAKKPKDEEVILQS